MKSLVFVLMLGCASKTSTAPTTAPAPAPAPAPASGPQPEGGSCLTADDCQSKVCEGQGCDADHPGKCVSAERICTQDMQAYCGCDHKDFFASGTCPGRRYAARGNCPK